MDREVENVADFTTSPRWGNKAEWNWRSSVSESIKANTDFDGHGAFAVYESSTSARHHRDSRVDVVTA